MEKKRRKLPWVTPYIHYLIERFKECDLEEDVWDYLESLPEGLSSKLGCSPSFWLEELSDKNSKIRTIYLIEGSLKKALGDARRYSKKKGTKYCEELEKIMQKGTPLNWLSGFIKNMSILNVIKNRRKGC